MIIIDENGNRFTSLKAACRFHSVVDDGYLYRKIGQTGTVTKTGHTFTAQDFVPKPEPEQPQDNPQASSLLKRLEDIYTPDELERIASGEGLARPVDYPSIQLSGAHHRIMVISDTHIGSSYSPYEWHDLAAATAREQGCECVLHCGDLTEGMRIRRIGTQMYELSDLGYEAQKARAVEMMSKYGLPIYAIGGNHDAFFKEYAGADVVEAVADRVEGMTYLGGDAADIEIEGVRIRLWHGGDGSSSYALSYRLQKVIESLPGGNKPGILLAGHVHKFCYIFERNVHAISCPSMQMQTPWMRGKRLAAHTGFLILDFDVKDGCVCNLSVKYYPFYA